MSRHCENCRHLTSIPYGSNGFEYPKLIRDKNCPEFHVGEEKPGTCEKWEAKGIPFYLQKQKKIVDKKEIV